MIHMKKQPRFKELFFRFNSLFKVHLHRMGEPCRQQTVARAAVRIQRSAVRWANRMQTVVEIIRLIIFVDSALCVHIVEVHIVVILSNFFQLCAKVL